MSNAPNATQAACPVCGTGAQQEFMHIAGVPVNCNVLYDTAEKALATPRGDLRLGFCPGCGHVYNIAFDPALMEYTQSYENSLHFSPRFQVYAEALAERLISKYAIRGKHVIDIGCGKGDFLAMLCLQGDNKGVGFDPSYVPEYVDAKARARMEIVRDLYSPRYTSYSADLLTCRHVLEHIQFPRDFVRNVRDAVASRTQSIVFFEVPNVMYTLRDRGIWDLIYEHCSYFSRWSLARVFTEERFTVEAEEELYGGQFLGIDLKPATSSHAELNSVALDSMAADVKSFALNYKEKVEHWQSVFSGLREKGKRAAIWGGGSKGVMFLNTLKPGGTVECMIDINPRKQGMFVAGTSYPVLAPERLVGKSVDTIIIMNPLYRDEIGARLTTLGIDATVLVA